MALGQVGVPGEHGFGSLARQFDEIGVHFQIGIA
mgnify:CR=1 FL=1